MRFNPARRRLATVLAVLVATTGLALAAPSAASAAPRPLAAPGDSGDDGEGGSKSLIQQLEAASKGFVEAKEALDRSKKRQQQLTAKLKEIDTELGPKQAALDEIVQQTYRTGRLGPMTALITANSHRQHAGPGADPGDDRRQAGPRGARPQGQQGAAAAGEGRDRRRGPRPAAPGHRHGQAQGPGGERAQGGQRRQRGHDARPLGRLVQRRRQQRPGRGRPAQLGRLAAGRVVQRQRPDHRPAASPRARCTRCSEAKKDGFTRFVACFRAAEQR